MRNSIVSFSGMRPRIAPHLLPMGNAQLAVNAKFSSGRIEPYRAPALVTTLAKIGTIKSIYRFGKSLDDDEQFWFHFTSDTDVARGAIPDDTQERTYYTQAGSRPMVTDSTMATADGLMPTAGYWLGLPAATTPAGVTVTQGTNPDATIERQRCLLAYTYVSAWGEEGPPNAVSAAFDAMTGDTLNVINMEGPPAGQYNVTHKRLYVSVVDSSGDTGILRFWKEISAGATTYSAELDMTLLRDAVPENAMVAPPDDMFGIMAHPGGFMVGFAGQRVFRSEVFKPYGWPYFSPVADDIVGGAILGAATIICTKGGTYMATQADPITFTPIKLNGWQPCVSKRSIAVLERGIVYASPDGVVGVDQSGILTVLTAEIMTRDEWQAYKPESMMSVVQDDCLFLFYDTGVKRGGIILRMAGGDIEMGETDVYATAAYADERRDALFLVIEDGKLHKWDAGVDLLDVTWKSRRFIAERPQNVGAARVVADSYPVEFTYRGVIRSDAGDKEITHTKVVASARPFRLPGSGRVRDYEFTVSGTAVITDVTLASTIANITAE